MICISINPSKPALNGPFRYNLKKTFVIAMKYMTRRTIDSWIHFALEAAWPVSATMAMVILALGFVIFPTVAHESRLLTIMSQGLKPVALIAAALLGLISLAKWIVAFRRAAQISTIKRDENNPKNSAVDRSNAAHKFPEFRREPSIYSVKRSPPIKEWSVDLIQSIDWKRFEDVCQKFYEAKEIRSACVPLGSDGGIDMRLFQGKAGQATAIVQCKACGDSTVGVKPIRELLGVMVHEKVDKALFMSSGKFSDDAKAFASPNRITLIDGRIFLAMIKRLPGETRQELLEFATDGDYNIPTCPASGTKMWLVSGKEGQRDFWGCPSFPKCRQKFWARRGTSNPPTAVYQ